jgi:V8-like Glu-specific endopeptidase
MRLSIVILLSFQITFCYSQSKLSDLVQKSKPSIFIINTYDKEGNPITSGTGFFIDSKGIALSNYHVFEGAEKASITTFDGKKYVVNSIISQSQTLDLIKFSIALPRPQTFSYLSIANEKPKEGDDVFVIGNPQGLDYSVSNGIISSLRVDPQMGQIIQTTAPISMGNSGSPLINMNGEVIGVISYFLNSGQNLNFAVSVENVSALTTINKLSFPKGQTNEGFMFNKLIAVSDIKKQYVFTANIISMYLNNKKESEQKDQAAIIFNFSDSLNFQSHSGNMKLKSEVYEPWKKTIIDGDNYWRLCLKYYEGDKFNNIFFYILINSEQKRDGSEPNALRYYYGRADWHISKDPQIAMRYIGVFMITDRLQNYLLSLQ